MKGRTSLSLPLYATFRFALNKLFLCEDGKLPYTKSQHKPCQEQHNNIPSYMLFARGASQLSPTTVHPRAEVLNSQYVLPCF
ncbi:hypothetical protein O6H91_07G089900 [Diphasiastrum complanatum]|uniref:Uncharacterized protein n=1 Tax=Diphasiastrum complanatum TaxID=34168 RepID=A0ACC2D7M6_DIPCM|nr:hypothetical protein O6H91_07G089900 [Diphasiastrum complanatum]